MMEKLIISAVVVLFVGIIIPVPCQATIFEDCIYGYVFTQDTDDPVVDMEIQFIELTTNATGYTTTDETGFYYFDLNEFDTWATGDLVKLNPQNFCNYFVCHPIVSLADDGSNNSYEMNLLATPTEQPFETEPGVPVPYPNPLPEEYNYNFDGGNLCEQYRSAIWSYVRCSFDNDSEIEIPMTASAVRVCFTPCYQDSGDSIPEQKGYYTVDLMAEMFYRINGQGTWPPAAQSEHQYVIHKGEKKGENWDNVVSCLLGRSNCKSNTYDFRLHLIVQWEAGNFDVEEEPWFSYVRENIKFSFTGV